MTIEPAWLRHARTLLGTREAPGAANNPTIIGWAKRLGAKVLGILYSQDSVPWCGLFVAECLDAVKVDLSAMKVGVRASAWATWGGPLAADKLAPGAILVFQRPGGGHVAFYVGEDATTYSVLGGNQSDAVTITRIAKARCIARRWPKNEPIFGSPVKLASAGTISTDEA